MNTKHILKTFNIVVLIYLTIVLFFSWTGVIAYGHGLGDIIYAGGLIITVVIHLIITLIIARRVSTNKKEWLLGITGTIFFVIAVLYTYEFTLGRGGEYSWNGNIFFGKSF